MSTFPRSVATAALVALIAPGATAQTNAPKPLPAVPQALTVRAERPATGVAIDGRLDDAVWAGAQTLSDFTQQTPDPGKPATQRTEVRVLVDGSALYVAMRMFDNAPDSVVGTLARRDYTGYSDWAHVIIDSFHDRRTAFRFAVNPSGVKRDGSISGDQEWSEDLAWDAVWDASARRDSTGWTAEFRIPLSQLRFATSDSDAVWGVEFGRDVARRGERSYWAPIPPMEGRFVSLFGSLSGVPVREARRRVEIAPYAVARASASNVDVGNPLRPSRLRTTTFGADFKIGLTSDLTITGTVNPDFGQVEADPSQVNLTGAETFYAERRPFFTEGADLFQYGMNWADWVFGGEQLFYSRRIGRMPQLDYPDSAGYTSAPTPTQLLAAAKLSGKTRGWSLGLLSATTARETGRYMHPGGWSDQVIEPLTHYGMLRVSRDFEEGRSGVGFIGTATNRGAESAAADVLHASAYAGGLEGRRRFWNNNYAASAYLFGSVVSGTPAAIARTQTSFRHLFQRDPVAMGLDSSATSLSGLASEVRFNKIGGGKARIGLSAHVVTRGFDINDMGYITASNFVSTTGWVGRVRNEQTAHTREWSSFVNWWGLRALSGNGSALGANWWNYVQFKNHWELGGVVERYLPGVSQSLLRGGPEIRTEGRYFARYRLGTDPRRTVSWFLSAGKSPANAEGSRSTFLGPGSVIRPTARAEVQLQPSLSWERNASQFIDRVETPAGDRYLLGDLRQLTASLTARGSYAFTANLTLQAYAQPFVSRGHYLRVGEVLDPRASVSRDRVRWYTPAESTPSADGSEMTLATSGGAATIGNPDFSFTNLNANVVLRWEYRSGSTFYAVWNQGRSGDGNDGQAPLRALSRDLWRTPVTNVLLVKWSHHVGR